MWEITSTLADRLFALSNLLLIAGAAAVLVGTIGSIVLSGVREQFTNERLSANERATAEAQARASEADQKTREAELALEKLRQNQMPRTLTSEQLTEITAMARRFPGQKFLMTSLMGDSEGRGLAMELLGALDAGGWDHGGPTGILRAVRTDNPKGIEVKIKAEDIDEGRIP